MLQFQPLDSDETRWRREPARERTEGPSNGTAVTLPGIEKGPPALGGTRRPGVFPLPAWEPIKQPRFG